MANLKISELTAAGALDGSELVEIVQGGTNKQTTTQDIADLGGPGGGGTWGSITGTLSDQTDLQTELDTIPVKADQTETNTGTDDAKFITPLKSHVKGRKSATPTTNTTIDQEDHDQAVIFSNSASAINFEFPVLAAGTYLTIIQINDGDITWTADGTSFVGPASSINGGDYGTAVTFYYRTTTQIIVISGDIATLSALSVNGVLGIKAGTSSGIGARVGGSIHNNSTTSGNVLTGEDTLYSYAMPANTLGTNGDSIRGVVVGTFAANGNNKTVKVKFGATTIFSTGAVAFNSGDWVIDFEVVRTGGTTQKCIARFMSSNTTLDETCDYTTAAETASGAITILVTGEATSTNDIVAEGLKLVWVPA